jgi:hypothetical protein
LCIHAKPVAAAAVACTCQVNAPLHEALQQHKALDDCPTAKQLFPALQHALRQQAAVTDAEAAAAAAAAALHNSIQPVDTNSHSSSMTHHHGTRSKSANNASQQAIEAAAAASASAAAALPIRREDAVGCVAVLSDAAVQLQEELAVAYICKAAAGQVSMKAARQLLHNVKQHELETAETRWAVKGSAGSPSQQQQQQQQVAEAENENDLQGNEAHQKLEDRGRCHGSNSSSSPADTGVLMISAAAGNAPNGQRQQQCSGCKWPAEQSDAAAMCQVLSSTAGGSASTPGAAHKRHKHEPLVQQQRAHAADDASNTAAVASTAEDQAQPGRLCDADPSAEADPAVLSPGLAFIAEAVQQQLSSWLLDLVQQQLVLLQRRQLLVHQAVLQEQQDLQASVCNMQQDEQQQQQQEGQQMHEQQQQDQHMDDPQPQQNQHQHQQHQQQQDQQQQQQQQQLAQHLSDEVLPEEVESGVVETKGPSAEQQVADQLQQVLQLFDGQQQEARAEEPSCEQPAAATTAAPFGASDGSCSSQACLAAAAAEPCCGGSADIDVEGQDCSSQQQPEQQQHPGQQEQAEQQHQQETEKHPLLQEQMEPELLREQHNATSPPAEAGLKPQEAADSPDNSSSAAEACGDIKVPALVQPPADHHADVSAAVSGDSTGTAADCTSEGAAAAAASVVHCANSSLHDQQQQQGYGYAAGTTATTAEVQPVHHLQQPQLLTEQHHEQQQSQQQAELPQASPATATNPEAASGVEHKQQQQHVLDTVVQQTSASTRDPTVAQATSVELSTLQQKHQQQQHTVVLPKSLQPTANLQPLGGTVLRFVQVLPGHGYVAHLVPRLHMQQQLMMQLPQQHMLQPQQLVLPMGHVQAPCLRQMLQPLQATASVAQQQQQQMLLPQHKAQLQLALMQRARELQQQQQLQQGAPVTTSRAPARACAGTSDSSMPQNSTILQQKAVPPAAHKHKAAKRCLGRAAAHKAAARGSVKSRHQQATVQDIDCQDPAMLAALPVVLPSPAMEQGAAGPVAAVADDVTITVVAAAKRPAAGRSAGGKKKRSCRERTKPGPKAPAAAAAAGAAADLAVAAGGDAEHDHTDAAPAADVVLQPPHKRRSAKSSATAAALDDARASTDVGAAADDEAAALAPLALPQGAPVKSSVLLRMSPICLSQGAILSVTTDPLLRAMLLEQPALMRAVQTLLHKVCVVWRRQKAHHQGFAAADTDAAAAAELSAAEHKVFDLQHPSADLVCWDTLDRMVQHPSSIQIGNGSGAGASWQQQQQRQRQPLYPTDDAGVEGDEAAAAGGNAAAAESDEEEVEYLSSLALAREVSDVSNCSAV